MNEGTTAFDLLGFRDATSQVVKTKLRQAYESGGVYLCDEIDAGSANAVATLNGLLANGECGFPDGMIPRHDNFVFLCAGNTLGPWCRREVRGPQPARWRLAGSLCVSALGV